MKSVIVVFKSRNQMYYFQKLLSRNGIVSIIINTPSGLGASCSLSLKLDISNLLPVRKIANNYQPNGIVGIFIAKYNLGQTQYEKIY